jgi:hypothetical protein
LTRRPGIWTRGARSVDIEKTAAGGKTARNITVAAVELAWDEPLRPPVWLRLHGVVRAGAKAPDKSR